MSGSVSAALTLRSAVAEDAKLVFPWRNSPTVRQFFFNSEPLSFDEHEVWFQRSLELVERKVR